ncbi:MAG: NCS1 family nucleobase:cation symporter-1 [Candidatus Xenobia bacterium]
MAVDTVSAPAAEFHGDAGLINEDLAPTPPARRNWSAYNYAALWIGMAHCIPTYEMASGLINQGMNWKQALFTIALGNLIVLVPMLLNSYGGTEYGLPFPVLCRASFGVRGANLAAILRALVACGWFGIQTWIGGAALNNLLGAAFPAWQHVAAGVWICFLLFWALNIYIIWKGMDSVRFFEGWAAPMVLIVAVVLLLYMLHRVHEVTGQSGFGPLLDQPGKFKTTADFVRHLPIFLTAQIGFWATLSLNMPDFTRFSKNQKSQMWGQALGLPTTMTFFSAIGVMITSAALVVYHEAIWDPTVLLSKPEFANPIVVVISLLSIGIATLSVNVAANVVSPAFDFANLWPEKIDFKIGGTITGVIGILMCPWALLSNAANYIFTWLTGYSALLGPIAGIMIADFWLLRRRGLRVDQLYKRQGAYTYKNGFNHCALLALALGVAPNVPGFLLTALPHADQWLKAQSPDMQAIMGTFSTIYTFAWMVGFAVAFVAYAACMRLLDQQNYLADRATTATD